MSRIRFCVAFLSLVAVLQLSACAGTPAGPEPEFPEERLRDADADLMFATEFPVATKADAMLRAEAARKEGELDKALFFYVKALKFDPRDSQLLAAIGLLHQFQGNAEYAVRAYTLALNENPDFAEVLEARGLILLAHDEDDRARADLTRAVQVYDSAWSSYNGLGLLAGEPFEARVSGSQNGAIDGWNFHVQANDRLEVPGRRFRRRRAGPEKGGRVPRPQAGMGQPWNTLRQAGQVRPCR